MKSYRSPKTAILAALAVSLPLVHGQANPANIGEMAPAEFQKTNEAAAAKVRAVKSSAGALSEADANRLTELARGSLMQLEVSRLAVERAESPDVRSYAEAEVKEQELMAEKLKELAKPGELMLPEEPGDEARAVLDRLRGLQGAEFDAAYLEEAGVKGHQMLQEAMQNASRADDAGLKSLAATALPLIQTHLDVAQQELAARR